ncbi:MAG: chorismate mutase [Candidatus Ornithospirochaeta sp.]
MALENRKVWALRGAITVEEDTAEKMDEAVGEMLRAVYGENGITEDDVVFTLFSQTPDLRKRNAAAAARKNGFSTRSPLFCVQEADIDGMLEKTVRVMIEVEKEMKESPKMIYLGKAAALRPDLRRK